MPDVLISTTATKALTPATTGLAYRVHDFGLRAGGAVAVQFLSDATALTGAMPLASGGVLTPGYNPDGHFITAPGAALRVGLSASQQVSGWLSYSTVGVGAESRLMQASAFWGLAGLTDASGNGHTLTNVGSVVFTGTGPSGAANTAAVFDGTNALRLAAPLVTSGPMSLTAFARASAFGSGSSLIVAQFQSLFGTDSILQYLAVDDEHDAYVSFGSTPVEGEDVPIGTWVQLAATTDGATLKLYVNGVLSASDPSAGGLFNNVAGIIIGGPMDYLGWVGGVALVGVYPLELTAAEVAALYNGGAGRNPYA